MRIDPNRDCRGRLPDHLSLPAYSDKFVTENSSNLVRAIHKGQKGLSLNELKWHVSLRGSSGKFETKRRGSAAQAVERNYSDVLFDERRDKIVEAASKKSFGSIRFSMA